MFGKEDLEGLVKQVVTIYHLELAETNSYDELTNVTIQKVTQGAVHILDFHANNKLENDKWVPDGTFTNQTIIMPYERILEIVIENTEE